MTLLALWHGSTVAIERRLPLLTVRPAVHHGCDPRSFHPMTQESLEVLD